MHQQRGQFVIQRSPSFSCVTKSRRDRDYHIAEQLGCAGRQPRRESFLHRERQYVGCSVLPAIHAIETAHAAVAHQFHAQFGLPFSYCSQHTSRHAHESRLPHRKLPEADTEVDGHLVRLARGVPRR